MQYNEILFKESFMKYNMQRKRTLGITLKLFFYCWNVEEIFNDTCSLVYTKKSLREKFEF